MKVRSEVIQPDASAWSAVVEVRGVVFVANRLACHLAPYRHPPRYPKWCLEHVRRWAETRIASLPPSWMQAHQALYQSAPAAAACANESGNA